MSSLINAIDIFDRRVVRRHRARAAAGLAGHDFLFTEVADRLGDRLEDIDRRFPTALDLGCHSGEIGRSLAGRGGIETLIACDLAPEMAALAASGLAVAADEEFLPFAPAGFDAVVSGLSLHWVNDLPGALLQIRSVLKPDGLFLAAMLGGTTLTELRTVLTEAELEISGGMAPRVSPVADVRDAGTLLQRAGFALPVVDADTIDVTYADAFALMRDLRGMGESNAVRERAGHFSRRDVLFRAAQLYHERYALADGRIPATFQVIWLTGWAPAPEQPRPARRGSGQMHLGDALKN